MVFGKDPLIAHFSRSARRLGCRNRCPRPAGSRGVLVTTCVSWQVEAKVYRANACFHVAAHCSYRFPANKICIVKSEGLKLPFLALDLLNHIVFFSCFIPIVRDEKAQLPSENSALIKSRRLFHGARVYTACVGKIGGSVQIRGCPVTAFF